jgi:hypothetical protein
MLTVLDGSSFELEECFETYGAAIRIFPFTPDINATPQSQSEPAIIFTGLSQLTLAPKPPRAQFGTKRRIST